MRISLAFVLAVFLLLSFAGASGAADESSFKALLKEGYEIKGSIFVPLAEAKMQHPELERGLVVLTLQNGQSVAVCDFNWANWAQLLKSTLENETLCDVRRW